MKSLKSLALGLLAAAGAASGSLMAAGSTYYLNDHLATTIGTADAAGEIAALEADAFGGPIAGNAPSRYTGKPYDDDMGAFVFPFRNYRAQEARWMSADPSGFPDGTNANLYSDQPFVYVDPLGLALLVVNVGGTSQTATSGLLTMNVDIAPRRVGANIAAESQVHWSVPTGTAGYVVQHVVVTRNSQEIANFYETWEVAASGIWTNGSYDFFRTGNQSGVSGSFNINGNAAFYTHDQVAGSSPSNWSTSGDDHPAGGLPVTTSKPSWFTGGISHTLSLTWTTE